LVQPAERVDLFKTQTLPRQDLVGALRDDLVYQFALVLKVLVELGFTGRAGCQHVIDRRRCDSLHVHQFGGRKDNPVPRRGAS
jgi:hypothetical protein